MKWKRLSFSGKRVCIHGENKNMKKKMKFTSNETTSNSSSLEIRFQQTSEKRHTKKDTLFFAVERARRVSLASAFHLNSRRRMKTVTTNYECLVVDGDAARARTHIFVSIAFTMYCWLHSNDIRVWLSWLVALARRNEIRTYAKNDEIAKRNDNQVRVRRRQQFVIVLIWFDR